MYVHLARRYISHCALDSPVPGLVANVRILRKHDSNKNCVQYYVLMCVCFDMYVH